MFGDLDAYREVNFLRNGKGLVEINASELDRAINH
jgi:hypothetical protein